MHRAVGSNKLPYYQGGRLCLPWCALAQRRSAFIRQRRGHSIAVGGAVALSHWRQRCRRYLAYGEARAQIVGEVVRVAGLRQTLFGATLATTKHSASNNNIKLGPSRASFLPPLSDEPAPSANAPQKPPRRRPRPGYRSGSGGGGPVGGASGPPPWRGRMACRRGSIARMGRRCR